MNRRQIWWLGLAGLVVCAATAWAAVTLVKADWSSGNLRYLDSSNNVIATIDGPNRKINIPAGSTLDVDGSLDSTGGTLSGATPIILEGATADAFETSIAVTDPTADRTVTVPDAGGAVMLSSLTTNGADAANAVTGASNALVYEGATADGFETSVSATDPTADRTVTLADAGGTVMLSSLATNAPDAANGVSAASNALVLEGATADGFETSVTPADPTADRTVTLADASGTVVLSTLATNAPDAANSVSGASNAVVFEGATADASEISVVPQDPTADRTITLPNAGGIVAVGFTTDVIFCGDLGNNTTVYTSPASGFPESLIEKAGLTANDLDYSLAGTGCAAQDDATEATADEPLWANNAVKILGMVCKVSSSGTNGVVLRMRSAAASLTPDVTMTIATANTTGATVTGTTTDIAAGATVAVAAVTTEDLSAQDFWCMAKVLVVP